MRYRVSVSTNAPLDAELEARFAAAVADHRAGRLDDAARAYEALVRIAPQLAAVWAMQGVLALQHGRAQHAVELLEHAVELDPEDAGACLNLGNALRAAARSEEAIAAYRRSLALDPSSPLAHNNLANALRAAGQREEAERGYRRALALAPSFFAAAANLAQLLDDGDRLLADRIAAHERALAIAEANGLRGRDVANVHNARANLLARAARNEEAIAGYREAIALDPEFAQAHVNLGSALQHAGELEAALAPLRRGLELDPDEREAYKQLAFTLRRLDRDEQAGEVYRAWHERMPDDPIAAHMAHAGRDGDSPTRGSDAYVRREFDDFADAFDDALQQLDYRAPRLIEELLARSPLASRRDLDVLDAGCGTGLCAPFLRDHAARLVGVDLSPKMLAHARTRGGYDELVEAELTAFARSRPLAFDLVVAADVLVYFGELDDVLSALRDSLRPGGLLLWTAERGVDDPRGWRLGAGGRYAHAEAYLRAAAHRAGLAIETLAEVVLRRERGLDVQGSLVAARRA